MNFKILNISAENFKAFKEIKFDCHDKDAIIIGGKNGYRKTTLFDIIELALTGEIKRYKDYAEKYTDKRIQKNSNDKPLVNDIQQKDVVVQIEVMLGSEIYRLKRVAETNSIGFQLNFSGFSQPILEQKSNSGWIIVKDKSLIEQYIAEIQDNFSRFYYIPQEETLEYLKSKEKDRPAELQKLFDISFFEQKSSKINEIKDKLKETLERINHEIEQTKGKLDSLSTDIPNTESALYERLVNGADYPWDAEQFNESFDFQGTLAANGIIDDLLYFTENKKHYESYNKKKALERLINNKNDIALWLHCKPLEKDIENYKVFIKDFFNPVTQISLSTIRTFSFDKFDQNDSIIEKYIWELSILQASEKSFNGLQRAYSQLDIIKAEVIPYITNNPEIHKCPLCGHDHESSSKLAEALKSYTHEGEILQESTHKNLVSNIDSFRERVLQEIIFPQMNYYKEKGISEEIVKRLKNLSFNQKTEYERLANDVFKINFTNCQTLEEKISSIDNFISTYTIELDETINYDRLDKAYSNAAYLISNDKLTTDCIKQKRQYLINEWNKTSNKRKAELTKHLSLYNKKYKNAKELNEKIKQAEKSLNDAKKAYLNKIINDVKILFYIYSGRIMQDCFYGRGLFLVYNEKKGYVNFTSSPNSGVDALYMLSSGQMIALILSFTLSLNKLYRKINFMLIDDPIQCIDDINIWGLFETLRHEFHDYSFILSTHEDSYASLLRYRLDSFGFKAEYRNLFNEGERN